MGDKSDRPYRSPTEYPKIRPVEAFPVLDAGRQFICLRDPQRIAQNILSLPFPTYYLVTLMDGIHSLLDMQEAFVRQFREIISQDTIRRIIAQLDTELFMESETFEQARRRIEEEFRASPYRAPAHAGTAYQADPQRLREQLDGYFAKIEHPSADAELPRNGKLSVLIAPHIDLERGGLCYAQAYQEIRNRPPSDLYIIFGTAHQCRHSLMTLTRKSYDTPLGPLPTDCEFVDRFSQSAPFDIFEEELLHRDEHSIEFQVLYLRRLLGSHWKGKVVPILSGSFHPYIHAGRSPREDPRVQQALDVLRDMIHEYEGSVTVVVGADLSHVGKNFGHMTGIPADELKRVEKDDHEVLDALVTGDAEQFYRRVEKKKNYNNICGLSPIYMALDIARPAKGYLLRYDRAIDQVSESVVTFAGLSFYTA
ncbi:MAG: AmmeMemoRadiSam system protein B [Candidatus Omnitrophota bacterium]|jgi:AmmeMemoRadiSam system protein B|nr:MAG: AmmeMemoRadiSam system protein B [Candidatus Omnitrophota bacterium]